MAACFQSPTCVLSDPELDEELKALDLPQHEGVPRRALLFLYDTRLAAQSRR